MLLYPEKDYKTSRRLPYFEKVVFSECIIYLFIFEVPKKIPTEFSKRLSDNILLRIWSDRLMW